VILGDLFHRVTVAEAGGEDVSDYDDVEVITSFPFDVEVEA
jgi:hypothetical protein